MLIDKKNKELLSGNKESVLAKPPGEDLPVVEVPTQVAANGPMDVLNAMKEILRNVRWEWGVSDSPKIFRTVQIDTGQYEKIVSKQNMEETMGFPAAFVHFIDWHYLKGARFNEGRATLRIRFILNSLNIHEDGHDMDVYYVAERINQEISESISKYPCLQEKCELDYIDPMENFNHGLQPCWMTYEVWFKQQNVWVLRNKIYKKFVFPPFANHSDQNPDIEGVNPDGHTDLDHPRTYDEASGYVL